jgi:glutaconate CoA-transferase subunit A
MCEQFVPVAQPGAARLARRSQAGVAIERRKYFRVPASRCANSACTPLGGQHSPARRGIIEPPTRRTQMSFQPLASPAALAARIPDGAMLAVAKDSSGVSMAVTRELIRRGVRGLHLVCVPVGGLQADLLIGAGCVATLETSAVTLGELGAAPRFAEAVRSGSLRMLDATCPAVYAALQASQKGIPFIPLRGLIGTDILRARTDWKVIDNPFAQDDPIVLLPAIRPDVALFHASAADAHGNVFIGREREVLTMAQASRQTLVTVEALVDGDFLEDDATAAGTLPAIYVSGIAVAKEGARPLGYLDRYPMDEALLAEYAKQARTQEGFDRFLQGWLGKAQRVAA